MPNALPPAFTKRMRALARSDREGVMNDMANLQLRALAARYYRSPEVYARAGDRLFYRTWQFACHASRIPEIGDYHAFSVFDQDLFVIRGRDGTPRCFFNSSIFETKG